MFGARAARFVEAEIKFGDTLDRVSVVLSRLEPVRAILRRIERASRDEHSREQAEQALKLLEIDDAR